MKKKILIFGKYGQLARSLKKYLVIQNVTIKFLSSTKCNFEYYENIHKIIDKFSPNIIINCSAYTNVEKAEIEKKKCNLINNIAVKKIAELCEIKKIFLIHFSTDYIFNSLKMLPIKENTNPDPLNYYGKSKLSGEKVILGSKCNYLILRISWTYSIYGKNFVKFIISKLNKGQSVNIVNDQYGCPTNLDFVSKIVVVFSKLILGKKIFRSKIVNISHNGETNWYNFAKTIQKYFYPNIKKKLIYSISSKNFKSKAKRPKYSKLSNKKVKSMLKIKFYNWQFYLKKFLIKNEFKLRNL